MSAPQQPAPPTGENPYDPGTPIAGAPPAGQTTPATPGAPFAGQPLAQSGFTAPPVQPATPGLPQPNARTRGNVLTSKPVIGIAALLVGLALGAGAGAGGTGKPATVAAAAAPTVTVTATAEASESPEADDSAEEPAAEPTKEPTQEPTATAEPTPEKKSYKTMSSRRFKLLTKDPDSYIGKTYLIYGTITQFDAATGTDTFRADTGPTKERISYGWVDYPQNSFLSGSESKLKKLVEGDCFTAKVTVLGSFSYDTQAGGNTTVPLFQIDSISVYGSTD